MGTESSQGHEIPCTPPHPLPFFSSALLPRLPAVPSSAVCSCCPSSGNNCIPYFSRSFRHQLAGSQGRLPRGTLSKTSPLSPAPATHPWTPNYLQRSHELLAAPGASRLPRVLFPSSSKPPSLEAKPVGCLRTVFAYSALGPREHPQERQALLY